MFILCLCHFISCIASLNLPVLAALSDNLFSENNSDDLLWDPSSILAPEGSTTTQLSLDDFDAGLELLNFDDSLDLSAFEDNDQTLFANTASQSDCDAAQASDLTLEARDDASCQTEKKGSSSAPILSPENVQLFQDPTRLLNDLLPPPSKEKQRPSGSEEPPPNPLPPLSYPGKLGEEKTNDLEWDLESMGLSRSSNDFFCTSKVRKVPVCCDGPFDLYNDLEGCDAGEIS